MNLINVNLKTGWKQYDDNLLDYSRLPIENYIVNFEKDDGLQGDNGVETTLILTWLCYIE